MARQLWKSLIGFFVVENEQGIVMPLRKFAKPSDAAGAAITCGVAQSQGLDRRIITDDFPGIATAMATMMRFAAQSNDRMNSLIPAFRWQKVRWKPSGLLETQQQFP